MDYYSLKMRASQQVGEGELKHEQHISGAERIVSRDSVEAVCSAMVRRAMTHSKGDPDFINVKIEKVHESDIQVLKSLPVTRVDVDTWQEGLEKAFGLVVGIYKSADRRILERFADIQRLPPGALKAFGDEYLTLCQTAQDYMDKAFDARGSGWASSVTEEGWKGWGDNNAIAASNLLAAVRLRPEEPRAAMMLSSLAGRSCAVGGDSLSWAMTSVSNSLDCSAETIERVPAFPDVALGWFHGVPPRLRDGVCHQRGRPFYVLVQGRRHRFGQAVYGGGRRHDAEGCGGEDHHPRHGKGPLCDVRRIRRRA